MLDEAPLSKVHRKLDREGGTGLLTGASKDRLFSGGFNKNIQGCKSNRWDRGNHKSHHGKESYSREEMDRCSHVGNGGHEKNYHAFDKEPEL